MLRFITCFAILALANISTTAAADPPRWAIDHAKSHLHFISKWQGAPVKGVFKTWSGDIRFDPADLAASSVAIEIDTASLDTAYKDRDDGLRGSDGFKSKTIPIRHLQSRDVPRSGRRQIRSRRHSEDQRPGSPGHAAFHAGDQRRQSRDDGIGRPVPHRTRPWPRPVERHQHHQG